MSSAPAHDPAAFAVLGETRAQHALLGLHRTLEFGDLWRSLQGLFETLVPHDTLVMSANYVDWRREASTRRLNSARSRVTDEGQMAQLVAGEGRNFFQPFLDRHPGIPCYQHTEVLADPRKIPATRFYQRYMQPLGWRYSAHMLFWRGDGVETSFALRRRADQGDFTGGEMAVLRAVHPQIGVAFERVRQFESEKQRRQLLETFYRAKPEAVLFVDWELRVLYASHDAVTLCAGWNLGPERASAYSPGAVFAVPAEISAACEELKALWRRQPAAPAGRQPPPLTSLVAASRPGFAAAITLRRETGGALTTPVFTIRLRSPAMRVSTEPTGPGTDRILGQLTPGERALAQLVASGHSNKEIATRLRRTEGSVKVQLSGAFAKLGLRSRAQLIVALR